MPPPDQRWTRVYDELKRLAAARLAGGRTGRAFARRRCARARGVPAPGRRDPSTKHQRVCDRATEIVQGVIETSGHETSRDVRTGVVRTSFRVSAVDR